MLLEFLILCAPVSAEFVPVKHTDAVLNVVFNAFLTPFKKPQ